MKIPSTTNSLASTQQNTNTNPMNTTKTSRSLKPAHVLVGSILALLAPSVSAQTVIVPISVANGSFEETVGVSIGGVTYYRGVDIWDRNTDGVLDGNGFITGTATPLGGQPTGNTNPRFWTTVETEQDLIAYDARWPQWDNTALPGPTDGIQAILLDKRGTIGANGNIKLGVGTVANYGTGTSLKMKFDTRFGEAGSNANSALDANTNFFSFFNVNGTRDTANQFASNMGAALGVGPLDRKIRTWSEMGLNAGNLPSLTPTTSPLPAVGVGLASQAAHMDHFSVDRPLAGLNAADALEIGVWFGKLTGVANANGGGTRVYLDNVTVELTIDTVLSDIAGTTDWHTGTTWTPNTVPIQYTPLDVGPAASGHNVTITTATANAYSMKISSGSVSSTGQILNVYSVAPGALDTVGGTLALDGASTLNIAKADTTTAFAGLTVAAGTILNVTSELTVNSVKDLSGATINTPKVTLAGGTLTKTDGLIIGNTKLISGNGTVAGLLTVASGGKVSPGTDTTLNTINADSLTLDAGGLLTVNMDSGTVTSDQLLTTVANGLTINGGAITVLDATGSGPLTTVSGPYNVIGYTGAIQGAGTAALSVANPVAGRRYAFNSTGSFVTLDVSQGSVWSDAGGGGLWSNGVANWSGVSPIATDVLVYDLVGSGSSVNDLVAGSSFKSIQFNTGAAAFTLTGNAVNLTGFGGEVVRNNSTNTQIINLPVTLGASGAINAASGAVVFDTSATIDNNGNTLTVTGAQPVTLRATMTGVGGLNMAANAKLNLGADDAVSGTMTINAGGTIDNTKGSAMTLTNNPAHVWNGDFIFTGTNDLNFGTGAVTITKNGDEGVTVNGGAARIMTIGGPVTMAGASSRLVKKGTGTMVISSAGSNLQRLQVTAGGTLLLDNSVAATPSMTVVSERVRLNDNNTILDINNFALTTPGMNIDRGRIIVRGSSVITNTGGNRITGSGDSNAKSFRFKDNAVINGGSGNFETSWTQAAQSYYVTFENSAQGTFANVRLGPNAEYADSSGHNTVLDIKDTASITTPGSFFVLMQANDQNRSGFYRGNMQVYHHGGTVTVGANLSIAERDIRTNLSSAGHQATGAYNLHTGSVLNLGGRILGGAVDTKLGKAFVNLHGGQINYTGAGAQSDWINLTVTAGTAGNNSHENLRLWQNTTINTGAQNLTINQAILAPTGNGISAIATTGLTGTVYTNDTPPWVLIEDTTGSGASAVPTINAAGNITGFTITNPGNNYSATPTVRLIRGDMNIAATVSGANISFADNATTYSGGLKKTGSGILTLGAITNGINTYRGLTDVQAGTLQLNAGSAIPDTGAVNVADVVGATLLLNANETIGSLSGGGLVGGTVNLQANTLTVGDASATTFGGTVTGTATTGAVVKEGAGVLNLAPGAVLTFDALTANNGTLNVNSALGTGVGTGVVAVNNAGTKLRFGSVSQTLSSLTIGAGATVIFTSGAASGAFSGNDKGAGFGGGATVPEPGTLGLLLVGALGMLNRRRRA